MLDRYVRPRIDPALEAVARRLSHAGVSADAMTLIGGALGIAAAVAIGFDASLAALGLIVLNRICDGLDGTIARATGSTDDAGGFLDITVDFAVYAAIPLGFAVAAPPENALAAAFLLSGFLVNGAAFLAYARVDNAQTTAEADAEGKAFAYLAGLAGGTETVIFLLIVCAMPSWFAAAAAAFAALCWISGTCRIAIAYRRLQQRR
ncbi:MAG: CDP-alcohol phosphatidyltransferase family protein [Pseudomonadota bacterium]